MRRRGRAGRVRARRALLVALLLFAAADGPARSQEAPPAVEPPPAASAPPAGEVRDEIVVTARKREEDLREVPLAVTVLAGETLEESAASDLSDLQSSVPNLALFGARNQSTTLTAFLRGVGQVDALWGVDPGVGLYLDGVYVARPQGALLDVFDVERIEVLRGPQGTLFGKNTIGGAIHYLSRAPTEEPSGSVAVGGGSHGALELRASAAGAIVPGRLRGKVAFASLAHEGYGTNRLTGRDVSDRDGLAGRAVLEWLPNEAATVRFALDASRDDAAPKGYERLEANPLCPRFLGRECPPLGDRFDTESGLEPRNGTDATGAAVTVSWRLGGTLELVSVSSWRRSDSENDVDFDTTPARIADVTGTLEDEQWSQELRLVHEGERSSGVLGLYVFDGEAGGRVENVFLDGTTPSSFTLTSGRTGTESIALFGDGTLRLAQRLRLSAGVRVTREEKNGVAYNALFAADDFLDVTAVLADYDRTERFDSVAPRLGFDYSFAEDAMGYLSIARGFKSGGFNLRAQSSIFPESGEPFDDEVLDVVEAGVKALVADGALQLATALFHGDYDDVQVSTFTAYDSDADGVEDSFFGNFLNAGDATIRGAEAELSWTTPFDGLALSGFVAWLDAAPSGFLDENHDGFVDTQAIVNAPEWSGAIRAELDRPAWGGLLSTNAGAAYRGRALVSNEGGSFAGRAVVPTAQEPFWLFDAGVSWLSRDARWRFGLAGRNLADAGYRTSGYNVPAFGIRIASNGAPRSVVATVERRLF